MAKDRGSCPPAAMFVRCTVFQVLAIILKMLSISVLIVPCGSQSGQSPSNIGPSHFFGPVDSDESLSAAIDIAAPRGRMLLVAVSGPDHMVTALNMISQFRKFGEDSVFILTPSQEDCEFVSRQHVVHARVCGWTDALSKERDWWKRCDDSKNTRVRVWHLRLLFLHRILSLKRNIAVMMTDTDVCYRNNVLDALDNTKFNVVLNGNSESINIGLVYGKRRDGDDGNAERFYGEVARRMTAFRVDGIDSDLVTCKHKVRVLPLLSQI